MTKKVRTRFRIISLVALLAIAAGTVFCVSAQTTEKKSESEAAEQNGTETVEQVAENEAETEEDEEIPVPVEVAEITTGAIGNEVNQILSGWINKGKGQVNGRFQFGGRIRGHEVFYKLSGMTRIA